MNDNNSGGEEEGGNKTMWGESLIIVKRGGGKQDASQGRRVVGRVYTSLLGYKFLVQDCYFHIRWYILGVRSVVYALRYPTGVVLRACTQKCLIVHRFSLLFI